MEKSILSQKDFRQESQSNPDTLAAETTIWISRIKRHIEITNCDHCKRVLNDNNNEAGSEPAPKPDATKTQSFARTTEKKLYHHELHSGF
jgi:N-acetylmuramoyl-L-alanine amidase CwlA